jgi:hypothetical protein
VRFSREEAKGGLGILFDNRGGRKRYKSGELQCGEDQWCSREYPLAFIPVVELVLE